MKLTKTQLKRIIKEELIRSLISQEAEQYHKIHGRIDEAWIQDIARKYAAPAAMAGMLATGVGMPGEAEAGPSYPKDIVAQHETGWLQQAEEDKAERIEDIEQKISDLEAQAEGSSFKLRKKISNEINKLQRQKEKLESTFVPMAGERGSEKFLRKYKSGRGPRGGF